jgi:hypothetical protein
MADPRIYSLEEAERALPLVRRIVADIQRAYGAWRDCVDRYEIAVAGAVASEPEPADAELLRVEVDRRAEAVASYLTELQELGCEFKDFRLGLVDFYALLDDRLVFLCWQMGENGITHWHELDAGLGGRQPIDQSLFHGIVP